MLDPAMLQPRLAAPASDTVPIMVSTRQQQSICNGSKCQKNRAGPKTSPFKVLGEDA
jgi:hypothetical protein